jgi:hypothetical protein
MGPVDHSNTALVRRGAPRVDRELSRGRAHAETDDVRRGDPIRQLVRNRVVMECVSDHQRIVDVRNPFQYAGVGDGRADRLLDKDVVAAAQQIG